MKRRFEAEDSSEDESKFEEAAVTGQFILSKSSIEKKQAKGKGFFISMWIKSKFLNYWRNGVQWVHQCGLHMRYSTCAIMY